MKLPYIVSIIVVFFAIVFESNKSYSSKSEINVVPDISIEPVSQRITNNLSTGVEFEKFDKTINRFLKKWEVVGATVALVDKGQLVFAKGYGYSDQENKIAVEPNNLFRVASVSKLITASAIMKLQEQGKLTVKDKVFGPDGILNDSIYLAIRDKKMFNITIEHLLRHSSGFSSRYGDQMFLPVTIAKRMNVEAPASAPTIIKFALSRRLSFKPGSRSSYSNLGYAILEQVINKRSGIGYEEYVKNNILAPAGVTDMHIGKSLRKDKRENWSLDCVGCRTSEICCCYRWRFIYSRCFVGREC